MIEKKLNAFNNLKLNQKEYNENSKKMQQDFDNKYIELTKYIDANIKKIDKEKIVNTLDQLEKSFNNSNNLLLNNDKNISKITKDIE